MCTNESNPNRLDIGSLRSVRQPFVYDRFCIALQYFQKKRERSAIEEKSLALVKKYDMENHVLFSSFDYRAIKNLRALDEEIPVALLYERRQSGSRSPTELIEDYKADAFNCSYRQLSKGWMEELSSSEIPVFVYTVNDRKRMQYLKKLGVSGIFTDKPDILRDLVENMWETN